MSVDTPPPASRPPARGRGAPARPVGAKMHAQPAVLALAGSVQELIRVAYPHRPWAQLVARLDAAERRALGGGEDRQLAQRVSSQFGSRSSRGPSRELVDVALRYCLPAVGAGLREQRRVEVEQHWLTVHGTSVLAAAPARSAGRRRSGGLGEQLRQEQERTSALSAELFRLTADNRLLEQELKTLRARLNVLEAERAASLAPPPVGITARPQEPRRRLDLVRPYTPLLDPAGPAPERPGPAGLSGEPAGPDQDRRPDRDLADAQATVEAAPPTAAQLTRAYRDANQPRTFLPLPQYRPELAGLAPDTSLAVPPQPAVGRFAVPAQCLVPAPRLPLDGGAVWGAGLGRAPLARPDSAGEDTARLVVVEQRRRQLRCEAAWVLTELGAAWMDQWADLPVDQMPAAERGAAQLPLLATALALASLIATMPPVLM